MIFHPCHLYTIKLTVQCSSRNTASVLIFSERLFLCLFLCLQVPEIDEKWRWCLKCHRWKQGDESSKWTACSKTLVCIQIHNLFVQVCLCVSPMFLQASHKPYSLHINMASMSSFCSVHLCIYTLWIAIVWEMQTGEMWRHGYTLPCTHTNTLTSQGVSLQIGFSPPGWQSWQALYERNKQDCFASLLTLAQYFQFKASNLLLNWWT